MLRTILVTAAVLAHASSCAAFSSPLLTGLRTGSQRREALSLRMAEDKSVMNRREAMLAAPAFVAGAALVAAPAPSKAADGPFSLPKLPYAYDALEPYIDKATMEFHHDKHFNAYLTNLNKALDGKDKSLIDIQKSAIKDGAAFRNNGGGFYNHGMFFSHLAPPSQTGKPSPALAKAIDDSFGSMDKMKEAFNAAAAKRFGSGWAWLGVGPDGKLVIGSTPNQDNPLMEGAEGPKMMPFLGLDVWEHAYYLKYQNRRPEYITAFWSVVNWAKVSEYYENFAAKGQPVAWQ